MNIYNTLSKSGGYYLPSLIHFYNKSKTIDLYFVDSDMGIVYEGQTYNAAGITYTANVAYYGFDGGGKLEISPKETGVIDLVEKNIEVFLDVIGTIAQSGEVTPIKAYKHHYGKINGSRSKITFTFEKDDRPDMTFPSLIWSTQNNHGNS